MSATTTDRYDVVIVGARCAGAATALLLARRGLRVLLLDRARPGTDTLSTHALMRGGAMQLHRWGLLEAVAASGAPPVRRTVFHYGSEIVNVSLKPLAGVPALYAPRRTVLDALLVAAAAAAGATVRFGVTATDLLRDGTGRVTGIRGRDRTGATVTAYAGLAVGADGVRSLVARRAGARTRRTGAAAGAVVYGYWRDLPVDGYEWFYQPGSSAGMIPTNDGLVCVFAGASSARFAAEVAGDLPAGYARLLKETGDPRLLTGRAPGRLYGFPGRRGFSRDAGGPGWALVGDAGSFLDPLSTHGMTDALRDAELLAMAVDRTRAGQPEADSLAEYQTIRDSLSDPMLEVVDAVASYRWTTGDLRGLLLQLSAAMSVEVEAIGRFDAGR
jgi:flavin-dependent dehydrogenase